MTSSAPQYNQSTEKEQPKFRCLWDYCLFLKAEIKRLEQEVRRLRSPTSPPKNNLF